MKPPYKVGSLVCWAAFGFVEPPRRVTAVRFDGIRKSWVYKLSGSGWDIDAAYLAAPNLYRKFIDRKEELIEIPSVS